MTFADAVKLPDAEYQKHLKKLEQRDRMFTILGTAFGIALICAVVVSILRA